MMWTRGELKGRAKDVLRNYYWQAFVISIIIGIAGGNHAGNMTINYNVTEDIGGFSNFQYYSFEYRIFLAFMVGFIALIFLIAIVYRLFLGFPLEVGGRYYFIKAAEKDVKMGYIGFAFKRERYWNIVKTMLWRGFILFLWTLLLIIPGIVMSYAYRMVPYILADNPNIDYKRAMEISKKMTDGQKFNIWVLDLSFIGWYILGMLALFIGVLFVRPYDNSTNAELYLTLRKKALDEGKCSYEELNVARPTDDYDWYQ